VRKLIIQTILPLVFAVLPLLGATLILLTLPERGSRFYFSHLTPLDYVIISLGGGLFLIQTWLAFHAMRWQTDDFADWPDVWLSRLSQSSEWFPLLGLIGTVGAILQTFSNISETGGATPDRIIGLYAPALTATGSGLFMALVNILPGWMVLIGRGLIESLGGRET